jgi:hypothetical protein
MDDEKIVADLKNLVVWSFVGDRDENKVLQEAKNHNQKNNYEVTTFENFYKKQREYFLNLPLREIDEEEFDEALNVLPPLKWCTRNNIEMFCCSEMYSGSFTEQYAHNKTNNIYYSKMVDCRDSETWIDKILLKNKKNF